MAEDTPANLQEKLEPMESDTIAEIGNISMGAAATALSTLLDRRVNITTPQVSMTTARETRLKLHTPCVVINVRYISGLAGNNILIISERDAGLIANLMMGDPDLPIPEKLEELYLSAVSEAMNQMMGSTATAMSDMFQRTIDISPPEVEYKDFSSDDSDVDGHLENKPLVRVSFRLHVEDLIDSELLQLLPVDFARQMVKELIAPLVETSAPAAKESSGHQKEKLAPMESDTLAEIGNISMGAAATALSTLLDRKVDITTPQLSMTTAQEFKLQFPHPSVVVRIRYLSGLAGSNVLVISERDAGLIAKLMMGEPELPLPEKLEAIYLSAVGEAMNQMVGSAATAMSDMFRRQMDISPPEVERKDLGVYDVVIDENLGNEPLVQVSFRLHVEDLLDSELVQLLPVEFARRMARELLTPLTESAAPLSEELELSGLPDAMQTPPGVRETSATGITAPLRAWREDVADKEGQESIIPLDLIRDIPVRVAGLFGRCILSIKDLLRLTGGAVLELDNSAADPVDILANGKLVARGEVVLVDDYYGIKITEIVE